MRAEDLLEFTRRRPFMPYRIHVTGGQNYEIRHPDLVIVLRSRIEVGVGGDGGVPDHVDHVALLHVVRIEELESARSE